jgi:hypothetical protein
MLGVHALAEGRYNLGLLAWISYVLASGFHFAASLQAPAFVLAIVRDAEHGASRRRSDGERSRKAILREAA